LPIYASNTPALRAQAAAQMSNFERQSHRRTAQLGILGLEVPE
jgi:hypothetical protein